MNYVNYFKHQVFQPEIAYRRYDFDFPSIDSSDIKRVVDVALPFLSLYRPIGRVMSLGLGGARVFSHFHLALQHEKSAEWKKCAVDVSEMALAVLGVGLIFFHSTLGLFVVTSVDLGKGVVNVACFLKEKDYAKAIDEAIQVFASSLYLAFMATGALELMLVFTLVQASKSLYQARSEIAKGRYLEGFAKIVMMGIHLKQAKDVKVLIDRRSFYLSLQKYQNLIARALKGREARHLIEHPLNDLEGQIEDKKVILSNFEGEYEFGSHFHGFGKGLVKGANLAFRIVQVDGKEMIECEWKVNHVFRDMLETTLKDLSNLNGKEMEEILRLTGSHAERIQVVKPSHGMDWDDSQGPVYRVNVAGLGSISIGASQHLPNLYDKVTLQMDKEKTIYDLHELLSFTGLDATLACSDVTDLERLKMGHLFRTFFPREATPFERDAQFFSLSLEDLKAKMIEKCPSMKEIFEKYLETMKPQEILPGRIRYQIAGLSDEIQSAGGRVLTAAITGAYHDSQELYKRVASLLSMGMISQEFKDKYGISSEGLGGSYFTGGADSVYAQMLTDQNAKENLPFSDLYHGKVRLLISLDALETGTYQYLDDDFGSRMYNNPESWFWHKDVYANRPSILELTDTLQKTPRDGSGWEYDRHEIMLKERLDPKFFKGLVVSDDATKNGLIDFLRKTNLIQGNEGSETILGVALDQFIHVTRQVSEDLYS